ncbi:MAG: acyl transferase [Ferruginibacter sp.]
MTKLSNNIPKRIFDTNAASFQQTALEVFRYQFEYNSLYRKYCQALNINIADIKTVTEIPFLPISFFKTKEVVTTLFEAEITFESSGTSGMVNSRHKIKDLAIYKASFLKTFAQFYGNISEWCIIGLLPSYLERKNASLVFMVDELIHLSQHANSGFYLYDFDKLYDTLIKNEKEKQPTLLIGVTYALLDFADKHHMNLNYTTVMETGGMKGRLEELTRQEVQQRLKQQLGVTDIHSEYGMTELLSQAYSKGNARFSCPPWMKILIRAEDDPFDITGADRLTTSYKSGAINIVDLANIYSASFIATDDIGKLYANESFEIEGRLENSDMRGCGLMIL